MTYFWSLYLNFNFCAVRSLFPDPLTYVELHTQLVRLIRTYKNGVAISPDQAQIN